MSAARLWLLILCALAAQQLLPAFRITDDALVTRGALPAKAPFAAPHAMVSSAR
jgi:hypothetical protein